MLGSSTTPCQGTGGPQPADQPFAHRRPTWPILFFILLFFTTAASKEDQSFLNRVSAIGWPTGNVTTISTEKPTNLGHAQWGQPKTDLSFSRLFNQTGVSQRNASQSHISPLQHLDALSDDRKSIRRSYSTLASVHSMGTSLQDMVSSTGTESLGTIEGRSRFLPSSIEGTAQSSDASKFFISHSHNLSGLTSIPSHVPNSRKTLFDQTAKYNEEYDTVGLVTTPTDVTIPVTHPFSSLWVSARYPVETTAHVAMPTSATSTKYQLEETSGVPTQPQSLSLSSRGRISRRVELREVFPPSVAIARSHLDQENSTAIHPSEERVTASPPIHSLVTGVSSSAQQSTSDSIWQGSQQLEVSSMMPLTNSSPAGSSPLEFSLDVANNESDQMVPGPTDTIPSSVATKIPRHKVSLGVAQLPFAAATVGLLKEANPQSSVLKEHSESFPTTSSFGTSKEGEISLTSHNRLNSSLVEVIKPEPKGNASSIVEGYIDPTVSTISKGETDATSIGVHFLNHQTSSPFSTLLSGNAKTRLRVSFQTDLLETTAHITDYGKLLDTQYYGRKRQITASVEEIPTSNSPLTAMETDSVRKLTSVQPVDALSKRGTGTTPLSSLSSTTSLSKMWQTSKASSEPETIADSLVMKVFSLGTTKNDSVPSFPHLDTGDVRHPVGATSTRLTYADLPEGHTTPLESFGRPSVEQKLPSPSESHPTVSLPGLIELDRSLVTPSHHSSSSSVTFIPFPRIRVPESTSKTFINITEGHLVRKGQVIPTGTKSFSATPLSLESRNTVDGIALSLPTKVPRVGLSTSSVMVTMENALGHQVTGTSTANNIQTIGRTTLSIRSSRFSTSSNSNVLAYPSSVLQTKSNQATPLFSASTTLWTIQRTLPVESKSTCRNISCPVSIFTPPQNISTQSMTSRPFSTRKFLNAVLGTMEPEKNVTLADAKVSRSEEIETTTSRTKIVTGVQHDHSSQQPRSKFTTSPLNLSVKENLTPSKFASTVPAMRVLSLWFRLIKINYTRSLMNKSSESYKKLEKEIKLTLKKILSTYQNFLHARVLRFLNGSVIVESQVVFQGMGHLPTPSDIIRTIVTGVESRRIDAFFDWRIDVRSLHSNGFSLKNLEPEKLAVFFSLLEMGSIPTFDDKNFVQEHLESVKIKMKLLLGTRYAVHLISLVDKRNTQGGVDVNGNIFIKSDSHVDVHWILRALIGLSNVSVDLISLSINGSKLSLQVFPVSFLITNRIFNEKMLDRSSVERQNIAKDLSNTLTRILGKYKNLLQVTIRRITGGSLVCYGDVIFQPPAPSNKDVLQTLAFSVNPKDYLDSSSFQVDRFSFTVAGAGLEPSLKKSGVPVYAIVLILIFLLAVIAVPTFLWLPKALARRGKITINREDARVCIEVFELDNPGYQATVEQAKIKDSCN
ncbi:mucin-17-like [Pseudonaja textilis]|uniref:mucin-17-like n=1 Tax=Pseudonaja textilis TaxID=8673 RepID=UPI000EA9F633|nr:mucin-17-like [Pseudonaja textilis]